MIALLEEVIGEQTVDDSIIELKKKYFWAKENTKISVDKIQKVDL